MKTKCGIYGPLANFTHFTHHRAHKSTNEMLSTPSSNRMPGSVLANSDAQGPLVSTRNQADYLQPVVTRRCSKRLSVRAPDHGQFISRLQARMSHTHMPVSHIHVNSANAYPGGRTLTMSPGSSDLEWSSKPGFYHAAALAARICS